MPRDTAMVVAFDIVRYWKLGYSRDLRLGVSEIDSYAGDVWWL